jgi:phenylpropionate dioxygenase-like ring-hydroxylating dioxygenase large terminal subunit
VAALEDACPHRKLPLSMGRVKGDTIECGYHGLTVDCSGACAQVPGAEKIPHVARVQSYPTAERYGLLCIWMGDAEKADPAWGGEPRRVDGAGFPLFLHDRESA